MKTRKLAAGAETYSYKEALVALRDAINFAAADAAEAARKGRDPHSVPKRESAWWKRAQAKLSRDGSTLLLLLPRRDGYHQMIAVSANHSTMAAVVDAKEVRK